MTWPLLRLYLIWTFFTGFISCRAIMAIDYGDQVKLSLAKKSFSIVQNESSYRSTWGAVAVTKDDILFSFKAGHLAARKPQIAFSKLKYLLGSRYDSEEAKRFQQEHPEYEMVPDTNRTQGCAFKHPDFEVPFAVEELIAYQLDYFRQLVTREAQEPITDCVITVPPYYTDSSRRALYDAAKIANLTVVELITDVNAAILHHSLTMNIDEEPKYLLFTDIGSSACSASLAAVSKKEVNTTKGYSLPVSIVEILGTEWDRSIGGDDFTNIVFDKLVDTFRKAHPQVGNAFLKDDRLRFRLHEEAKRLKHILTINTEYVGRIDEFYEGLSLSYHMTVDEFKEAALSLVPRIMAPITRVLECHNMTVSHLEKAFIVGNGFRPPVVLDAIRDLVTSEKLSMRIVHDEVSSLGACFRGAQLHPNFSTKAIQYHEKPSYDYHVSTDGTNYSCLFNQTTTLPSTKNVTMKTTEDFEVFIQSRDRFGNTESVSQVKVKFNSTVPQYVGTPKVKLPVSINGSGVLNIGTPLFVYDSPNNLTGQVLYLGKEVKDQFSSLSAENLAFYQSRMDYFLGLKKARKELSDTRNELESLCYSLRNKLDEEYYGKFVSTEGKGYILKDITKILGYLDDDMFNLEILNRDLKIIKGWMKPIENRMKDYEGRPACIENLLMKLNATDDFIFRSKSQLDSLKANITDTSLPLNATSKAYSELQALDVYSKDMSTWLTLRREQQDSLPTWESAILLVKDLEAKCQLLDKDRIKASSCVKRALNEMKTVLTPVVPVESQSGEAAKVLLDEDGNIKPIPLVPLDTEGGILEDETSQQSSLPTMPELPPLDSETVTGPPERLEL